MRRVEAAGTAAPSALASLQKALDEYIQGEKDHVSYMDCLWGELYGAINSNQWSNAITLEQADYLRAKYL